MEVCNGLRKVTAVTGNKVILGKVVELSHLSFDEYDNPFEFKIVKYFVNKYKTYTSLEIVRFTIEPDVEPENRVEEFKRQIEDFFDESEEIYVSESVLEIVTSKTTDIFSVIKELMKKRIMRC